jgi:DNA replication protein DnaC
MTTEPTSVYEADMAALRREQAELILPDHIPARYRGYQVERPDILAWADDVIDGSTESLMIGGEIGTGKTGNAYAALQYVVRGLAAKGLLKQIATTTHARLLNDARPGGEGTDRFFTAELLVLDDLGATHITSWNSGVIEDLINTRWDDLRPTIFTSNLSPAAMAERMDPRIPSRLFGMCRTVILNGPDRRQQ